MASRERAVTLLPSGPLKLRLMDFTAALWVEVGDEANVGAADSAPGWGLGGSRQEVGRLAGG